MPLQRFHDVVPTEGLAGLVLAAGASSRLGQAKALLLHRGQPLICRAVSVANEICGAGVTVVTGSGRDALEQALEKANLARPPVLVHNTKWRQGMGSSLAVGVRLGVRQLDSCVGVLVLLCDQPLLRTEQFAALAQLWQNAPNKPVAAAYEESAGVPAIFPRSWFSRLAALQNDQGARSLLKQCSDLRTLDMPEAALDIDTPDDLHLLD